MSLHYLSLGNSLGSTKLVETLIKASKPNFEQKIKDYGTEFDQLFESQQFTYLIKITLQIIDDTAQDKTCTQFYQLVLQPIYSTILYWLTQVKDAQQKKLVDHFCKSVDAISDPIVKTKLYAQLFNSFASNPAQSLQYFYKLLNVTQTLKTSNLILPAILMGIDNFISQWTLDQDELLKLLFSLLESVDEENHSHLLQLTQYILKNTIPPEEQTVKALILLQNSNPTFVQIAEIIEAPSVKQIQRNPVYAYFNAIIQGNVQEVENIVKANNLQVNVSLGLNHARISKLISISENQRKFSFQQISKELNVLILNNICQIPIELVEIQIISAIQSHNIRAQIDQQAQDVYIWDNSSKIITLNDWKQIQERLKQLLKLTSV
ncbi:Eukaryotic translation initiation factor 3 subunit M [Paramecium bursaria]